MQELDLFIYLYEFVLKLNKDFNLDLKFDFNYVLKHEYTVAHYNNLLLKYRGKCSEIQDDIRFCLHPKKHNKIEMQGLRGVAKNGNYDVGELLEHLNNKFFYLLTLGVMNKESYPSIVFDFDDIRFFI